MRKSYLHNPGALKIDLMLRGVRLEDPSMKEHAVLGQGVDIVLKKNTLVNVPCCEEFTKHSPYMLKRKGGGYSISDGEEEVRVELVEKPEFYRKKTTTGVPFPNIGTIHGSYTVITPSARCDFFNRQVECKYCAGNLDIKGLGNTVYSTDEVLETVEEVFRERASEVIYLSIGFSPGEDGGIEFLKPYISAIKKHFNCLVAVEALPPGKNHWIDETYAAGADSILYNLEIFDNVLFEIICPGRAALIGRQRYLDSLRYAATIFPSGTVASHLIVGLEPPGSTCMGIDFLTEMGVVPILPIYRPAAGRNLRIDPLTAEIIIPVYKHLYRAVKKNRINMHWVRDISMVTTPIEGRVLVDEGVGIKGIVENFYKTRIGLKTAWGLSTLRRKLRVKEGKGT